MLVLLSINCLLLVSIHCHDFSTKAFFALHFLNYLFKAILGKVTAYRYVIKTTLLAIDNQFLCLVRPLSFAIDISFL
jgi:hypothetical protein